jgi:hypothetical protein
MQAILTARLTALAFWSPLFLLGFPGLFQLVSSQPMRQVESGGYCIVKTRTPRTPLEEDICVHIFAVSAAMVGVCLTVIGLVQIVVSFRRADTIADDLLAIDALLFLIACLSSYWVLRTRNTNKSRQVERLADAVFILAMTLMACICGFIVYAVSRF